MNNEGTTWVELNEKVRSKMRVTEGATDLGPTAGTSVTLMEEGAMPIEVRRQARL